MIGKVTDFTYFYRVDLTHIDCVGFVDAVTGKEVCRCEAALNIEGVAVEVEDIEEQGITFQVHISSAQTAWFGKRESLLIVAITGAIDLYVTKWLDEHKQKVTVENVLSKLTRDEAEIIGWAAEWEHVKRGNTQLELHFDGPGE